MALDATSRGVSTITGTFSVAAGGVTAAEIDAANRTMEMISSDRSLSEAARTKAIATVAVPISRGLRRFRGTATAAEFMTVPVAEWSNIIGITADTRQVVTRAPLITDTRYFLSGSIELYRPFIIHRRAGDIDAVGGQTEESTI